MQISLNKNSDVPLHDQLTEQIVFLITTGRLRAPQQLPSVRSLARQLEIHHNTVSRAYQNLVGRGWLRRQHGSRLHVGGTVHKLRSAYLDLDELINQSIERARKMGYSLQELQTRVLERLFAQPPDHILVVEEEPELQRIIHAEISSRVGKRVATCSPQELASNPRLAVGAQAAAPDYIVRTLSTLVSRDRPAVPLVFSPVDEQLDLIRKLEKPSIIGVASVSSAFLRTSRSLLAPALGQRHVFREVLLPGNGRVDVRGLDLLFCDSLAMPVVRCPCKVHYRLIMPNCLDDLIAMLGPPAQKGGKATQLRATSPRRDRKSPGRHT